MLWGFPKCPLGSTTYHCITVSNWHQMSSNAAAVNQKTKFSLAPLLVLFNKGTSPPLQADSLRCKSGQMWHLGPPLQHRQHSSRIAVDYRPSGYSTLPHQISVLLEANAWQINKQYLCKVLILHCATANTAISISACVSKHFAVLPGMNKSGRVIWYLLGSLSPTKQAAHSQGQHCARDCKRESELPTRNGNAQKSAQNNNCFHKLRK